MQPYLLSDTELAAIATTLAAYFDTLAVYPAAALDFVYPPFFDHLSRELMLASMGAQEQDGPRIAKGWLNEINQVVEHEGIVFATVRYTTHLNIAISQAEYERDEHQKPTRRLPRRRRNPTEPQPFSILSFMLNTTPGAYLVEKTCPQPSHWRAVIALHNQLLAIRHPHYEGWKLLELKPGSRTLLALLLPPEVLAALLPAMS